ncbi:hypothetical protein [Nonomuraea sp. NPDC003214]
MTTPTVVDLISPGASRDEIIAHLDADPAWQRRPEPETTHHTWHLQLPPTDPYSSAYSGPTPAQSVTVRLPAGDWYERLGAHYLTAECAKAARTINAVALRMWPFDDEEIVDRIVAAYQALDPGHPAALILSGRAEDDSA